MIIDPKIYLEKRKVFNRKRKSSFHIRGNKTLIGGNRESSNFRSRGSELWVVFQFHAVIAAGKFATAVQKYCWQLNRIVRCSGFSFFDEPVIILFTIFH